MSKILWLFWLLVSFMMIVSKMKTLLCPQHFPHHESMRKIYDAQGQVIPQQIVWFGLKSNLSEILYLSLLPASFTKIQSKMKTLSCPQHVFLCSIDGCSLYSNSSEILCLNGCPGYLLVWWWSYMLPKLLIVLFSWNKGNKAYILPSCPWLQRPNFQTGPNVSQFVWVSKKIYKLFNRCS